jgi:hypothetical protein
MPRAPPPRPPEWAAVLGRQLLELQTQVSDLTARLEYLEEVSGYDGALGMQMDQVFIALRELEEQVKGNGSSTAGKERKGNRRSKGTGNRKGQGKGKGKELRPALEAAEASV